VIELPSSRRPSQSTQVDRSGSNGGDTNATAYSIWTSVAEKALGANDASLCEALNGIPNLDGPTNL
jgi:hypothetical protein